MHKKKFLSRTSFASLFLLLGTVLSACSKVESTKSVHPVKSFKSDLKSLLKETIKQDIDLSKTIKTSEGKQQIITSLKKSYGVNPKDTTKLLLDAWKQSFEEGEIGIADLDFEVAYPKTQDPFTMERKVDHFQMTYQSFKDLSIKAKLSYTFNWFGDYSSGGFTAKKG
ncbi:lipoprotein, partial [Mycoplasmoides pneumoniae]